MISIQNLVKFYPNGTLALDDVNINIHQGEFVAIIGSSGSGKSTLLRCINRLIEPSSGAILMNDVDICKLEGKSLRKQRAKIGMIFQHFNLIDRHSVLRNVFYGGASQHAWLSTVFGMYFKHIEKIKSCLSIVGLADKIHSRADSLSGGQKQRVSIARTLFQEPQYLLADEPVSALDPVTSKNVMEHISSINKTKNVTVICNLHSLQLVKQYATRAIAIRNGKIIYDGSPESISDDWVNAIYEA